MKKVNFYWIIVALVVLKMSNGQIPGGSPTEANTEKSSEVSGNNKTTISDNFIAQAGVSGRWMR